MPSPPPDSPGALRRVWEVYDAAHEERSEGIDLSQVDSVGDLQSGIERAARLLEHGSWT